MTGQDHLEPDHPQPADERARAGVRAWIRDSGRRTRDGLRAASPYAILAFLTASVVAPVAGAGLGASDAFAAALDQVGGLGSNYLADTMAATARRLREDEPESGGWSEQRWRDALAADLLPRLAAADERGRALHEEVSRVLREVDAVAVAITEAAVTDEDLQRAFEAAFQELGYGVGELSWMVADVRQSVDGLRQDFVKQAIELNRRLDEVRRHLVDVTRERLPAGDEVPADVPGGAVPPYPGLVSFQPEDAPRFRGREPQIAQLLSRVAEQALGGPPLVVTGVSGVGKSSLLRAGLLPAITGGALGAEARDWSWVLTNPGVRPLADLLTRVRHLAGSAPGEGNGRSLGELAAKATAAGHRPIIVVDQFEELFTQCPDPAERLAYVTALTGAAPAIVVIAVRSDFYPACVALPPLARVLTAGHVVLGPLDADAVRRAVVEPAEHAGLTVEPGLPGLLLRDLGADGRDGYEPGALPLLAHALRATWDRREGIRLTVKAYQDTGGIRHAIADTAERIYLDQVPEDRDRLRDALLALVTVTADGTPVRRRGERAASDSRVLRRLVRARLVTVGADTVEISHEALLTSWPRLAGWVAEAREDLLLRESVTEAARDWERSGRDPDLLPRGSRLIAARERITAGGDGVPPVVGDYLTAGGAAAAREQLARERATRRLRALAAGLGAALLVTAGAGLVVLDQRGAAEASGRESRSRQYASEALRALPEDEPVAVRKALAGWNEAHTEEARGALLSTQMVGFTGLLGTDPGGSAVAVSPDGTRAAIGGLDGTVRLWDVPTLSPVGEVLRFPEEKVVASVAFSPDGRYLAAGSYQWEGLRIWDAATGRAHRELPGWGAVAWLPGGTTLAAGRRDRPGGQARIGLWDGVTGAEVRSVPAGEDTAFGLAVSADGRYLAELDAKRVVQVRRSSDGRLLATLPDVIAYVAFAPDGSLVTSGLKGDVRQWEVPSGKRLRDLTAEAGTVPGPGPVSVSVDGAVFGNGPRRTASIWSLDDTGTGRLNTGLGQFGGVATSADGKIAVATGQDGPSVVFRRQVGWLNIDGGVTDVAFSLDGRRLAATGRAGLVRTWDTATRDRIADLRTDGVPLLAVYGAGGVLAVATDAGTLELWNAGGRREATVALRGDPKDLVVSPDGRLLAVSIGPAADDEPYVTFGRVILYDLERRTHSGSFDLGEDTAYAIAFSADGSRLHTATVESVPQAAESGLRSNLRTWRLDRMAEAGGQYLGPYQVLDLALSPDGTTMVVAGTSRVLDVRTADGGTRLWASERELDQIDRMVFAPDGRTLAVSSVDGGVRLWDMRDRSAGTLQGHDAAVYGLAWSPDGRLLVSGSADSMVAVWPLETDVAVDRLCAIAVPLNRQQGMEQPALCR